MKYLARLYGFVALVSSCYSHAQSFSADPPAGVSPVKVTLRWNILGAESCEASGSWSGTKPAKGELVTTINARATYALSCVKPGAGGTATLTWKPPTTNLDKTPLTDGAGYTLVHGLTETTMDHPIDIPGIARSSYTVTDLPAGNHFFGLQAYNSAGVKSERVVASKVIVATPGEQTFASSVTVDVSQQPSPPTEVTIAFSPGETPQPDIRRPVRNLTPICADASRVGQTNCATAERPTRFDYPRPDSIVKSDGIWSLFGPLGDDSKVLVCAAEQLPGAIADPYRSLCATDTYLPKSQVPLSPR